MSHRLQVVAGELLGTLELGSSIARILASEQRVEFASRESLVDCLRTHGPNLIAGVAWPADTTIKYTERGNPKIAISDKIGGPKSEIKFHVQAPGDLHVNAPKGAAGAVLCGVPPPPF
jgi:hypothetical protein